MAPSAVLAGERLAPHRRIVPSIDGQGDEQAKGDGGENGYGMPTHQWLIRQQTGERSRASRVKPPKIHSRSLEWP